MRVNAIWRGRQSHERSALKTSTSKWLISRDDSTSMVLSMSSSLKHKIAVIPEATAKAASDSVVTPCVKDAMLLGSSLTHPDVPFEHNGVTIVEQERHH